MGFLSALTSPVASLLGTVATGVLGARSASRTNRAASAQAARSMEFEERLSKTAHQRQVADMRKAGLNPILSATGGSGASTPSGKAAPVIDPLSTATQSVSTALQTRRLLQEIKNLEATERNTIEQTNQIKGGVPARTIGTDPYNLTKEYLVDNNRGTSSSAKQYRREQIKRSNVIHHDKERRSYKPGYGKSYK